MPDNQSTEETITGIYESKEPLRSGGGTRLFIRDDNYPQAEHPSGVTVFDNNPLAERAANDLEPGMRVSLRISVKQGPRGKQRNLLEILNRFSNPTPPATQPVTQAATPNPATWGSIDERIAWNSGINNAGHVTKFPESIEDEARWLADVDRRANLLYPLIRRGPMPPEEEPEEPTVEGDVTEDNPF